VIYCGGVRFYNVLIVQRTLKEVNVFRPRTIISFLVLILLLAAPMTTARAGMQMPEALAAIVPQYPGSTVILSHALPGGPNIANLNCGKASQQEVSDFYKAKLAEKGFSVNGVPSGPTLLAVKGKQNVMVDFDTENGATIVVLTLTGGESAASGGQMPSAPGMPSMPGAPGMPSMPGAPGMPSMPSMPGTMPQMPAPGGSPTMPTMPTSPTAPAMPGPAGVPGTGNAQYPGELAAIVAQYPGSRIISNHEQSEGITSVQVVNGANAEQISKYYKTEMLKGGWEQTDDVNIQGNIALEFEKDDLTLSVFIQNPGGMYFVTVALEKE
jgi:hypothetical protein